MKVLNTHPEESDWILVSIHYIYKETATLLEISCTVGSSLPKSAVNLILIETTFLH